METICSPLTREEVIATIEHRSSCRPPLAFAKWWGEGLWGQYGDRLREFDKYPEDVVVLGMPVPSFERTENGFCWKLPHYDSDTKAIDAMCRLEWKDLDDMIANPPNLDAPGLYDDIVRTYNWAKENNRYTVLHHWSLMFERIWNFRGMQNLFIDYIDEPENVQKLHRLMIDTEIGILKRVFDRVHPDGYMISDDLGNQRALMMSPATFREFIKPYYKELWSFTHSYGVHNWLHTCGCVTEIIDDLIECGLDVIHPIQKHTMDWDYVADRWKGKITFLAGMDVQNTLIFGTPEDARREVRLIKDTFGSPNGGLMIAAGNGIVSGTPFENIDAFLDECYK